MDNTGIFLGPCRLSGRYSGGSGTPAVQRAVQYSHPAQAASQHLQVKPEAIASSVLDPYSNWIRIQHFCGSVFEIRIRARIHTGKNRIN